ncbi:MAG TPA: hypothetical protein DEQ02_06740 [Ruminococcaceae bacterium]|nr:hypothetical protein [Oscillospiraceae bacterium]
MLRQRKGPVLLNMWLYRHYDRAKVYYEDDSVGPMSRNLPRIYDPNGAMSNRGVYDTIVGRNGGYIILPKNAKLSSKLNLGDEDMGMNDLCVCGSGQKTKKCHADIADGSAVYGLWRKFSVLDKEIERLKLENNVSFLCKRGCNACCSDYFYISQLEYCAIKNHLLTFFPNAFLRAQEIARAQWGLLAQKCINEYQRLNSDEFGLDLYEDHVFIKHQFAACPLLDEDDGGCKAYAARPFICRLHGISTAMPRCGAIEKHLRGPFRLFPKDAHKHMVDIEYSSDFQTDVNHFYKKTATHLTRSYPIFYWLAHDSDYAQMYKTACRMPADYFANKV